LDHTTVVALDRPEQLEAYLPAWEDLAGDAIETNVFYESWMLLPALRSLGKGEELLFVLVFATDSAGGPHRRKLCGIFPLQYRRHYRKLPARTLKLWKHKYCFLCAPLIRKREARATVAAFLDWLADNPFRASLMEFEDVPGEGPFHQLLIEELRRRGQSTFVVDRFDRGLLVRGDDGDAYVRASLSKKRRKELNRLNRRLSEIGRLECLELERKSDLETWSRRFLALESSGWKGRNRTAIDVEAASREYFLTVLHEAFKRDRLMMLGLYVDNRPVAMKCNLLAAPGSFAFKIAYDEALRRFSPGLQLEIANIHRFHSKPDIHWMDSCTAVQDHFMIDHLWRDRRSLQTIATATGCWPGDFVVSILPMRQWLRRKLKDSPFRRSV
jgi:CelD/BcsL family acetyltransferase involved in cellulose biosynthesis